MRGMHRVVIVAGALGLWATPAYAYLDPGTGSMLLQLVLGGVAGAAVAARLYWQRIKSLLGIKSKTASSAGDKSRGH